LRTYTQRLYQTILPSELSSLPGVDDDEDGLFDVGYRPIGFIELACGSADRLQYLRRVMQYNQYCGIDVQELSPSDVEGYCPIIRTTNPDNPGDGGAFDVLAGFYSPNDGRVNPTDVTMALARCAWNNYVVTIVEDDVLFEFTIFFCFLGLGLN
jgi:4-methylaminobutanoate oxidase (formaldehyde-forming)